MHSVSFTLFMHTKLIIIIGDQCNENSVQLIGELSQTEGVVAICCGGYWGKVCRSDFFFSTEIEVATVVCRQLGLSTNSKQTMPDSQY